VTLDGNGISLFAITDSSGRFSIGGIPIGTYTLSAEDLAGGGKARVRGSIDAASEIDTYQLNLDSTRPQVLSTTPANGDVGVNNNSTIKVVFSEPMDSASLENAFSLTSPSGKVSGAVTVSGSELTFVPSTALEPQKTHTIVVTAGAEHAAGNHLA